MEKKTRNIIIIVLICSAIGGFMLYENWDTIGNFFAGSGLSDEPEETTFKAISFDGEDVSWIPIRVEVPKSDAEFSGWEDYCDEDLFEIETSNSDAEDVSFDASDIEIFWVTINPLNSTDVDFQMEEFYFWGGVNKDITLYPTHQPNNVTLTVLDSIMDEWDLISDLDYGLISLEVNRNSTTDIHVGGEYATSQSDYDDLSVENQNDFHDQGTYRQWSPLYIRADDTSKDFDDPLEMCTYCPAVRFTFNTTVSKLSSETTYANIEILEADYETIPAEIVVSGTYIDIIFYSAVSFNFGTYDFHIDLTMNDDIICSSVATVFLNVPQNDYGITLAQTLCTAALS